MPKGKRHDPFNESNAKELGRRGGEASGRSKRQKKALAQIADELLRRECQGADVLEALEAAGFEIHRGKNGRHISNAVALTANIIRIGQGLDANAAVRAYQALAEMERAQAERDAAEVKAQAGGVVILPPADLEDDPEGADGG